MNKTDWGLHLTGVDVRVVDYLQAGFRYPWPTSSRQGGRPARTGRRRARPAGRIAPCPSGLPRGGAGINTEDPARAEDRAAPVPYANCEQIRPTRRLAIEATIQL